MGLMDQWDEDKMMQYANQQASLINPTFPGDEDPLPLPGLQDQIGSKLYGNDAETSGLNARQSRAARQSGLMAMAASLLQSSGPSRTRVGIGQALGAAMQAGQAGQLEGVTQQQQLAAMGKAKSDEMNKKAIYMRFPPPSNNNDPAAVVNWAGQIIPALVTGGFVDEASKLATMAKSLGASGDFYSVDAGDRVYSYNQKTGKYEPGPIKHMSDDAKQMALLKLQEQKARTGVMQSLASERENRMLTNAFMSRNNAITGRAPLLNQALMTLDQAKTDETLTSSAIINFMQAADQKAQIRWQLLNWFKANVKQSLTGRWDMAVARNFKGKLPPDVIAAMEEHLLRLQKMNNDDYERRRAGEEKRHPGLTLPPTSELGGWKPQSEDLSQYNFGGGPSGDTQ